MINFDAQLFDLDNNPIVGPDGKNITLGKISADSLLMLSDDDRAMTGEEKVARYELAKRVLHGTLALKAEEIAKLKSTIGKHYAPIIVGQAWKLLDPVESAG